MTNLIKIASIIYIGIVVSSFGIAYLTSILPLSDPPVDARE
jgi:hypothetical protein